MPYSNPTQMRTITPNPGDAVILDTTVYRPTSSTGHQSTRSAGSNDWKMWMSSEVSKLERAKYNSSPAASYINYAMPTMPNSFRGRHVRELAQIMPSNDADIQKTAEATQELIQDAASKRKVTDEVPATNRTFSGGQQPVFDSAISKQPLTVIHHNIPQLATQNIPVLKPILKNRSAVSLVENVDPHNKENSSRIPPPPPIPTRSTLRLVPLVPKTPKSSPLSRSVTPARGKSPYPANKTSSVNGRNMLHKRNTSNSTMRSVRSAKSSTISATPARLVKKNKSANSTPASRHGVDIQAVERRAASVRSISRPRTPGAEWRAGTSKQTEDDPYEVEGTGLLGPYMSGGSGSDADGSGDGGANVMTVEQIGSKTMVDMFLSSRRRRIASGSGRSEDSDGVFL